MNTQLTMIGAVVFAVAGAVHAQDCSGGTDGGMDATGNQCNEPRTVAVGPAAPAATRSDSAVRNDPKMTRPVASRVPRHTIAERLARTGGGSGR